MYLLDANVIIWWMAGDEKLGHGARTILSSNDSALVTSILTLLEIELKCRAGKLRLPVKLSEFLDSYGIEVYSPSPTDLRSIMSTSFDHKDPFDCALVGIAELKKWKILTSDDLIIGQASKLATVIDSKI